jgi:hypothetical protein
MIAHDAAITWEQRDVAFDTQNCVALVEEGEVPAGTALADGSIAPAVSSIAPYSTTCPDCPQRRHQLLWYEDVLGITVNSLDTKMTYYWDGHCATGGSTYAAITYYQPTGWYYWDFSSSYTSSCSLYRASSTVKFQNNAFCTQETEWSVPVFYDYNRVTGYPNGSMIYNYYIEPFSSCAPLSFHRVTGSWTP